MKVKQNADKMKNLFFLHKYIKNKNLDFFINLAAIFFVLNHGFLFKAIIFLFLFMRKSIT